MKLKKAPLHFDGFEILHNALSKESDRGLYLVCAELVDVNLLALLHGYLLKKGHEKVFVSRFLNEFSGPVSSLARKNQICFAFGLINEATFNDIEVIRCVRNKVAHTYENEVLDTKIVDKIVELTRVSEALEKAKEEVVANNGDTSFPYEYLMERRMTASDGDNARKIPMINYYFFGTVSEILGYITDRFIAIGATGYKEVYRVDHLSFSWQD